MSKCIFLVLASFLLMTACAKQVPVVDNQNLVQVQKHNSTNSTNSTDDDFYTDEDVKSTEPINDPLETFNRAMFKLNDKIIVYAIDPVESVYRGLAPPPLRKGIDNIFRNLAFPIRFVNSILQLKFSKAGKEVAKFVMNTALGFGGYFDVGNGVSAFATSPEDFGQTLGYYGLGHGMYLYLPFLGPSSMRDGFGKIVDAYTHPLVYTDLTYPTLIGIYGVDQLNQFSFTVDSYKEMKNSALDPYSAVRDAYVQYRKNLVDDAQGI